MCYYDDDCEGIFMLKESVKKEITDFSFLNLLSTTIVLQGRTPVFENQQLQKDLYHFYHHPNFNFLFEDVCKKESIVGNNFVDLGDAFQLAYAWGLLSMVQGNGPLKSVIPLSKAEAQANISQFTQKQTSAMNELVTQLYSSKTLEQPRVRIKKR